jgi:hypothetical protein
MEQYIVQIERKNNGGVRYIDWCNNRWYGTTATKPLPSYTMEQAEKIAEQLASHYVYKIDIVDANGNIAKHINWLIKPKKKKKEKKSIFKLNKNILKNVKKFGRLR